MRRLQRVPTTIVPITGTSAPILIAILESDLALTNVLATTATGSAASVRAGLVTSGASALNSPKEYSRTDVSAIVENEGVEPDIGGDGGWVGAWP